MAVGAAQDVPAGQRDAVAAGAEARVELPHVPFGAGQLEHLDHVHVGVGQGELVGQRDLHVAEGVLDAFDQLAGDMAAGAVEPLAEDGEHPEGRLRRDLAHARVDPVEVAEVVALGQEPVAAGGQGDEQVPVELQVRLVEQGEQDGGDGAGGEGRLDDDQGRGGLLAAPAAGSHRLDQLVEDGHDRVVVRCGVALGGHRHEVDAHVRRQNVGSLGGQVEVVAQGDAGTQLVDARPVDVDADGLQAAGDQRLDGRPSDVAQTPDADPLLSGAQRGGVVVARAAGGRPGRVKDMRHAQTPSVMLSVSVVVVSPKRPMTSSARWRTRRSASAKGTPARAPQEAACRRTHSRSSGLNPWPS